MSCSCSHLTLLFCAVRYGLSWVTLNYYSTWAEFSYRTAFVAAAVTYGIVVFKAYRALMRGGARQPSSPLALLTDENVQYLGQLPLARNGVTADERTLAAMAVIWLFSPQISLAILPFTIYSIFHVATYTRTNPPPRPRPWPT